MVEKKFKNKLFWYNFQKKIMLNNILNCQYFINDCNPNNFTKGNNHEKKTISQKKN